MKNQTETTTRSYVKYEYPQGLTTQQKRLHRRNARKQARAATPQGGPTSPQIQTGLPGIIARSTQPEKYYQPGELFLTT